MNKNFIFVLIFITLIFEFIAKNSLPRNKLIYKNKKTVIEIDDILFLVLIQYAKWKNIEDFKVIYSECVNPEKYNDILLQASLLFNNLEIVYYLIENKNLNINTNEEFILRYGVFTNNIYLVQYALYKGANLHIRNDNILLDVVQNNKTEILKLLLIFNKTYNNILIQNMIDISKTKDITKLLEDYLAILEYRSMK